MEVHELTEFISKYYFALSGEPSIIRDGPDNTLWLIEDNSQKKYVARVSKRDMGSNNSFESEWLSYLITNGVAVAPIVKNKEGSDLTMTNLGQTVTVFDYLPGIHPKVNKDTLPPLKRKLFITCNY